MTNSEEPAPGRALGIVAHPDDLEFAAGGTVAGWVSRGWAVSLCVVTDGQRGTTGAPSADRRAEQEAAAEALGVNDVHFLGGMDAEVEPSLALRATLAAQLRQVRPHRVVTHSPRYAWSFPPANHPDHRAVGAATLDAVYPVARIAPAPGDGEYAPWAVREVWLFGDPEANHFEDVTAHLPMKLAALRCHCSQHADGPDELMLRNRMAAAARSAGLTSGRLAERFQVLEYP
ncbi:MAG: LmbE family protein [Amycolatopsis sp.]|uniref:PIG-L deacetylase family protein n=1 Tax=Amycolatopsis sp. TaxID=37632 RepID=UPI00260893ED|nr:PIG-L deacetylase family protein [Amycolatopsis sp.]MCU1686730.1 LmbE family protein [Amycolatopsis sp.]